MGSRFPITLLECFRSTLNALLIKFHKVVFQLVFRSFFVLVYSILIQRQLRQPLAESPIETCLQGIILLLSKYLEARAKSKYFLYLNFALILPIRCEHENNFRELNAKRLKARDFNVLLAFRWCHGMKREIC